MRRLILLFVIAFIFFTGTAFAQTYVDMRANAKNITDFTVFFEDFIIPFDTTGTYWPSGVGQTTPNDDGWIVNCRTLRDTAGLGAAGTGASFSNVIFTSDSLGGSILKMVTPAKDSCGAIMQWHFQVFDADTNTAQRNPLYFETRVKIGKRDSSLLVFGLTGQGGAATDTAYVDSTNDVTDGITFIKDHNADSLFYTVTACGDSVDTTHVDVPIQDSTWVRLAFYWNGRNRVTFFINDENVAEHTDVAYFPTDEVLVPTLHLRNKHGTLAQAFWLDYVYVGQRRLKPSYD